MNEGQPERSGRKAASDPLAAAADDLRRNAGADQPTPSDSDGFHAALQRQAIGFFRWARGTGHLLNRDDFLPRSKAGGQEHRLWIDTAARRYYKITHPDQFGLYPEVVPAIDKATQKLVPRFLLRKALPAEYLERLRLQNELFADDHWLHGVIVNNGQLHTVISQPALRGVPPTKQEIYDATAALGFEVVRSGGSQFFYRPEDNTAVFDGHEGNFLKTEQGVAPIDVITVHPQGELMEGILAARG